jgi:ABC-type branched-subunit amino acid transport system ATPase component
MRVLLEVDDLCVNYGRIEAIRNVSFTVDEGEIVTLIGAIHAAGATVLLVEQNAAKALPLCDRAYLIHRGDIIASGSPAELDADPDLVARHLGLDPEIATPIIDRALTPNDGDA